MSNHKALVKEVIPFLSGSPYHGRWHSHSKYTLLCPYCQASSQHKTQSPGERSAALLLAVHDGWECWTFNCLRCHTKKRLDYFIQDHPHLMPVAASLGTAVGIISATKPQQSVFAESGDYAGYKYTRLDPVSPSTQAGLGGYQDSLVARKRNKRKQWWDI
jgi:hypothetical protein